MAISKKEEFSIRHNKMASLAKALAHPARIAILEILIKKGTCICGELVNDLPLSQSTTSQHLKALKDAGLVKGTIDGVKSCYCVNGETLSEAAKDLNLLFSQVKNCCS